MLAGRRSPSPSRLRGCDEANVPYKRAEGRGQRLAPHPLHSDGQANIKMKSLASLVALAAFLASQANAVAVWGQCAYFLCFSC